MTEHLIFLFLKTIFCFCTSRFIDPDGAGVCVFFFWQVQLYEDFAKSQVKRGLDESVSHFDDDKGGKRHNRETPHIFQVDFH